MDTNDAPLPCDCGTLKATMGALTIIAAAAAGISTTMAAPLFGGLTATALSAGAALAAVLETTDPDPRRTWRAVGWGLLVVGWIGIATLLLNVPQGHAEGLRPLLTVLIVGAAALRVWRSQELGDWTRLGIAGALAFALLSLTAAWSGLWLPAGDAPAAVSVACVLELFGTGSLWFAEGLIPRWGYPAASGRVLVQASARVQTA